MTDETPVEYGKGAIQSPPDENDIVLGESHTAMLAASVTLPTPFRIGNRPPVTNQGNTPQCVAYSNGVEQNWQDRVEHGRFFNFDERQFFTAIGGTALGAHARSALDYRLAVGYPEAGDTPDKGKHQIVSYALVTKTIAAIKNAIFATGGVLVVGPWYDNWTAGLNSKAVLPPPSGGGSGHEWWGIGWDDFGIVGQNSWGTAWGDNGLFRMPWPYVVNSMWEVWTTLDEVAASKVLKGRIKEVGTKLYRPARVVGPDHDGEHPGDDDIWGQARVRGIWRKSNDKIVAEPWDKWFKVVRVRKGARHGFPRRPETWVVLRIAGTDVAIPAPKVRLASR